MDEINVIYQFNEKYVPYAGVSITSLLINNEDASAINIYVLGEGLSDASKDILSKSVSKYGRNIAFPDTKNLLERFQEMGMIPYRGAYSVYLRMFFSEFMGSDVKRVLYLDADTIVGGDLLPLMNYDLEGKSIGMVLESITDDYKIMIGMGRDSEYYNSGVILFDADKWRENDYCGKIVNHIRNVRSSYIGDQDFLNIVCAGDICRLPVIYNYQPLHERYTPGQYFSCFGQPPYYSRAEIEKAAGNAVVYHCYRWLGDFPWNKGNLHPFDDIFDKYLEDSLWKGYVKTQSDVGFAVRMEKVLYRILPRILFIRIFRKAHELFLRKAEKDARNRKSNKNS